MPLLSDDEYAVIRDFVLAALDRMRALGLAATVETDLAEWVAVIERAPGRGGLSPTFDPAHSLVGPENAFWIRVEDENGPAACIASRTFDTEDCLDLLRNWRLWFDRRPNLIHRGINLVVPPETPVIGGRISHNGGLWVHPAHRKRGLPWILPRLVRALSAQHFGTVWHTALVRRSIAEKGLPFTAYGYTHMVPCIAGYYPAYDGDHDMSLCYVSRPDDLDRLAKDVLRLRGLDADDQRVDALAAGGDG